ncbi:GMC family oxidoreductase [Ureibacillus acetophenoni]|uniref:Gluconate 2-dehydrogenase alpha chain n=1 Tax=Ureibacillus acetophenoni TaxID=614649 RepID=A0A285UUQ7_9BACL|nr:GMC family oxidoreductase [Ureibacillus acetophenoni]SOC44446.1 gluconate 2-dehydrogenase alpha chain [Ureibacillus acetophenoni]
MVKRLDKVDVVTVGVGWMGGIVAAELTKAGFTVVGLEKGAERTREDYLRTHDELRYTIRGEMESKLNKETYTIRRNLNEEAIPVRDKAMIRIGTGTGGGGAHWGAQTHRYYPYDFEIRTKTIEKYGEDKIPENMTLQDWGITYDELEPYFDKFEKMAGVSGEPDPNYPERSNPYPNPPLKKTEPMHMFHEATTKLGYKPFVTPSGTVSQTYTNPDGEQLNACQYCAFCVYNGCEYGAKADPVITVIPTAKKTGKFELRNNARVIRVLHDGNKATGVLYVDTRTGEEFEQPADLVVLTSFVFNNVRLLLLSQIGKPYNPVTGEGVVGKNFTDHHISGGAGGFFKNKKFNNYVSTGCLGETITDFTGDIFDHSNLDFLHGGQIEMRMSIFGNSPIITNNVPSGTPSWGKEFKKESLYYHNRYLAATIQKATLPYKEYYLDLDPVYKDDLGNPLLRVTWNVSENDKNLLKFVQGKAKEILEEMGADIVEEFPIAEQFSGVSSFEHNAGGAIMGADPNTSVVNKYLQVWDCENLFVCGSSAFPHFSCTNPTTTAAALTYHAVEGMIKYLKDGGGLLVGKNTSKALV